MKYCKPLRYLLSAAALLSGLGLGIGGAPQPALAVTDLAPSHWAASTINAYVSRGVMSGYPDGTFRPEASVTRAEFVKMVNNVFGYNTPGSISFPDVSASYWGYDDIAKGVFAGYINGDENGRFNPEDPLTREEAASIICRIKGLAPNQAPASQYADSGKIATWAAPYVGAATQFGYMEGNGDGTFNPTKALSRAEAASVLAKAESGKTYTTPGAGYTGSSTGSNSSSGSSSNTNSNTLHRDGYTSSSSNRVSDYTMSSGESRLSDKTITGNLYLPSNLGAKTVHLEDLTVEGTVYVRGGGTIDVDDCDFDKVVLDKSGVTFTANSKSKIDDLEFWRNGRIEGGGYGDVTIADDSVSTVNIDAAVDNLVLDTDANVRLGRNADIDNFEATSNADRAKINFAKDAYVGDMDLYDRVEITGSGEINKMYTHVSGISSSIEPNKLITSGSGTRPTYTNNTGSDDDDDDDNNNSSNNNNKPGGSTTTPTVKDLVVTSNVNGNNGKKGDANYDTVTVQRAGVTVSNVIVDTNLIIDTAVADGTVTLDHVTVKGQVYIHGGGQNSIIFSDCVLEKNIYIDKKPTETVKQPVGLKLNNGTTLKGDIVVQNNANIATSPKEYILNKVIVDGTLTEPLRLDAHVDNLTVNTSGKLNIELDNSNINVLVAAKAEVIAKGKGKINDVTGVPNLNVDMLTPPDEYTRPELPNFKAIISLSGIPEKIEQGGSIQLDKIQAKYSDSSTATISNVVWTVTNDTAGVSRTDNLLTAANTGKFTLTGTVKNGVSIGKDFVSQPFTVTVTEVFIPAEKITANIREAVTLVEQDDKREFRIDLKTVDSTVSPSNASNREISWSVKGEGASINGENVLILTEPGNVTLTATVLNGKADGDLRETFKIKVDAPYRPVTKVELTGLQLVDGAYQAYAGTDFKLDTKVYSDKDGITPTNSLIKWELAKESPTGITQDQLANNPNPTLRAGNTGEIVLRPVISGGIDGGKGDYKEQLIKIKVNPPLVGDISVIEAPLAKEMVYYPGQTVTFKLPNSIMANYNGQLQWSIDNAGELALFGITLTLSDPKAPMPTLTIPTNFPVDKIDEIKVRVHNSAVDDLDKTTDKVQKIRVEKFIPVSSFTGELPKTVYLSPENGTAEIDLSVIKIKNADAATCKTIEWYNGEDKIEGDKFYAEKVGPLTLTAKVVNGTQAYGDAKDADFSQSFNIEVKPAQTGPIEIVSGTEPLAGDKTYYAGQTAGFKMSDAIMNLYGGTLVWTTDNTKVTGEKDTNNNYVIDIPADFSGKLKITATNPSTEENIPREYEITVLPFTSFDNTTFTISNPTHKDNTPDVKIGGTLPLKYDVTGDDWNKDLQTITWGFAKGDRHESEKTTIDDKGVLTIGADETADTIKVVATMANGRLVDNKLEELPSNTLDISVDRLNVSNIFWQRDTKDDPTLIGENDIPEFYAGENITFSADALSTSVGGRDIEWNITNLDAIMKLYPTAKIDIDGGKLIGTDVIKADTTLNITAQTVGAAKEVSVLIKPFTSVSKLEIAANGSTTVETGQTLQFTSTVTPVDATKASDIEWSIITTHKEGTKIENGLLTIANDEDAKTITVQAAIRNGKIASNKLQDVTSSAKVTPFTSVSDITIDYQKEGNNIRFSATVNPTTASVKTVKWTISGNKSGTSINATTGLLTIAADDDSLITVTATIEKCKLNNGTYGNVTATATVQNGSVTVQSASANSRAKVAAQPATSSVPATIEPEKKVEEEKQTSSKDNTIKKSAAEIRAEQAAAEREQIEAEKRAQRARQSSIAKGSGVSKTQVSAD